MDTRRSCHFTLLAALALLVTGCSESEGPSSPLSPLPAPLPELTSPDITEFVNLVNAHRASLGLAALVWDAEVAAVAQAHSEDMIARAFFSHTNPDGQTPFDRLHAAGIVYESAGENIAYGYPTAASVLEAWLSSPGHRANIERAGYTHHGVGLAGSHWTHVFVRRTQ